MTDTALVIELALLVRQQRITIISLVLLGHIVSIKLHKYITLFARSHAELGKTQIKP